MALAELSMLEQRYLAVREVLDTGATVSDVASRYGVDRRTLQQYWAKSMGPPQNGAVPELLTHGVPQTVEPQTFTSTPVDISEARPPGGAPIGGSAQGSGSARLASCARNWAGVMPSAGVRRGEN
jgi:hypothetical protein